MRALRIIWTTLHFSRSGSIRTPPLAGGAASLRADVVVVVVAFASTVGIEDDAVAAEGMDMLPVATLADRPSSLPGTARHAASPCGVQTASNP